MKQRTRNHLARATARELDPRDGAEFFIERDGPKAAAWLIYKHRKQFRRDGVCEFRIQKKDKHLLNTPEYAWFRLAIETLRRRQHWNVVEVGSLQSAVHVYRVRWMNWHLQKDRGANVVDLRPSFKN